MLVTWNWLRGKEKVVRRVILETQDGLGRGKGGRLDVMMGARAENGVLKYMSLRQWGWARTVKSIVCRMKEEWVRWGGAEGSAGKMINQW